MIWCSRAMEDLFQGIDRLEFRSEAGVLCGGSFENALPTMMVSHCRLGGDFGMAIAMTEWTSSTRQLSSGILKKKITAGEVPELRGRFVSNFKRAQAHIAALFLIFFFQYLAHPSRWPDHPYPLSYHLLPIVASPTSEQSNHPSNRTLPLSQNPP